MAWIRRRYGGHKVWVLADAAEELVLDERGLGAMRYRPEDERTYSVRPDRVGPLEEEASEVTPPPPDPQRPGSGAAVQVWTATVAAGEAVGVGALLTWRGRTREISRRLVGVAPHEGGAAAVVLALEALRRTDVPVRLHVDGARVLEALAQGAEAEPASRTVARLRRAARRLPELSWGRPGPEGRAHARRAEHLARAALAAAGARRHGP